MNETKYNKQLENWLERENECSCGTDEPDYCSCPEASTIEDFFAAIGKFRPGVKQIYTGYVYMWRDGIPYIMMDQLKTAKPVIGVEIPKNAMIVEVVGVEDQFGKIIAETGRMLANTKGVENITGIKG
jgi:hypothetical protein